MYKYTLEHDTVFLLKKNTFISDYVFKRDFLEIKYNKVLKSGEIFIPKGYSWDGCTPSWKFLGRWWGTPDTAKTYKGSLLHDALYQYKSEIELSRKDADSLFKQVLKLNKFSLYHIYYGAVRLLGGIMGKWKSKEYHNLKLR